jgi:thioredoxin 1
MPAFAQYQSQNVLPFRNLGFQSVRNFGAKIGDAGVFEMKTMEDWESFLDSEMPIILQTGADWCGPCKMLKPMMSTISPEYEKEVQLAYMDVDKFQEVAQMLEI